MTKLHERLIRAFDDDIAEPLPLRDKLLVIAGTCIIAWAAVAVGSVSLYKAVAK